MPNSKKKGNANETWAAKKLTAWWGSDFKRIPTSGALRWNGITDAYGDLLVPEDFPGIVECKHNKKFELLAILTCKPNKDNILGWWEQVNEDVRRASKEQGFTREPILIAKGNRTTPIIAVSSKLAQSLPQIKQLQVPNLFVVYALDDFLSSVKKAQFKDACRGAHGSSIVGTTKKPRRRRSGSSSAAVRPEGGLESLPTDASRAEGLRGTATQSVE